VARPASDSIDDFFKAFPVLVGRAATPTERSAFDRYANLLLHWNRTHHLTALRTRGAIARGLFLDSLLWRALLPRPPLKALDIGAGAGIPGIPLRLVEPALSLTLMESRRKPASFLRALLRELDLRDVAILQGRAEAIILEDIEISGIFDAVLTRSVGLNTKLIEAAVGYLRPGGSLIASGPPQGTRTRPLGWSGAEWRTIEYPLLGLTRRFLVVTKEN